ncbi:50S ribosomal protein L35, chloroplastic-like [Macadamia integrifolia]|uniref:50S ribosomal protein L35, chloroplastic-like n=1 Tax=Macadamia integrifolia TaxID=60698 RepID=UPI001C4E7962|nr:50S ribosomal protein L35, chloroplastic-like [Macadamia integrifolia]
MASATLMPFCLKLPSSIPSFRSYYGVRLAPFNKTASLNLTSSQNISGFRSILPNKLCIITSTPRNPPPPTIVAAKGYKMKTHKASAKRFRVTGTGKIVRRRAGKQHLLGKKNTKRKLRLSKMVGFSEFHSELIEV